MSIKSQGGVFGRNPTFNDVEVEGSLSVAGSLTVGSSVITGLNYQGAWDADTNTPDLTAASPTTGQFWIVSVDGSTNLGGITNWTSGDWALYDGSNWQRVEGGNTDLSSGVTGQLAVTNGGTGASDAATARQNLDLEIGVDVQAYDATILKSADIGSTVQGYDADTAKYDDTTANFTGTLQNGGSNVLVDTDIGSTVQAYNANILTSSDIGSTVQAYDADTAKLDVAQTFTASQTLSGLNVQGGGITAYITAAGTNGGLGLYALGTNASVRNYDIRTNHVAYGDLVIRRGSSQGGDPDTTVMHLTSDNNVKINSGNLVIGTSGKGIDFSATSGTGTSELLDDYEEGTYTATVRCTGNANTSTTVTGYYTKVGRQVTVSFRDLNNIITTSLSGILLISVPFACVSGSTAGFFGSVSFSGLSYPSGTNRFIPAVENGGSNIIIKTNGDGVNYTNMDVSALTSGSTDIHGCTVTYFTA